MQRPWRSLLLFLNAGVFDAEQLKVQILLALGFVSPESFKVRPESARVLLLITFLELNADLGCCVVFCLIDFLLWSAQLFALTVELEQEHGRMNQHDDQDKDVNPGFQDSDILFRNNSWVEKERQSHGEVDGQCNQIDREK